MKSKALVTLLAATLASGCTVVPPAPEAPAPAVQLPPPAPVQATPAVVPGIATTGTDRWYKDQYGRCYRVNEQGDRVYDSARKC